MNRWSIIQADALDFLRHQADGSLDLVFGSPPYEQARLYTENGENLGIARKTADWVPWMADIHVEAQRACKGLVAFVVAGQMKIYRWSAGPVLYMAELHQRGLNLRNPPIFHRAGIPGSGGPDWLRSDYEWIVCTSSAGKLAWSDNTACGHPPKYAPGGAMSHRTKNGSRRNQWGGRYDDGLVVAAADGTVKTKRIKPSHKVVTKYDGVTKANPGNVISLNVGGGSMGGDQFASQNEAPFPEKLAEFFILSFCRPGGLVCDPFSGSGTTGVVAKRHGRMFHGCDIRASQVRLGTNRIAEETPPLFA